MNFHDKRITDLEQKVARLEEYWKDNPIQRAYDEGFADGKKEPSSVSECEHEYGCSGATDGVCIICGKIEPKPTTTPENDVPFVTYSECGTEMIGKPTPKPSVEKCEYKYNNWMYGERCPHCGEHKKDHEQKGTISISRRAADEWIAFMDGIGVLASPTARLYDELKLALSKEGK